MRNVVLKRRSQSTLKPREQKAQSEKRGIPSAESRVVFLCRFVSAKLAELPSLLNRVLGGSVSAAHGKSLAVSSFESTVAASEKSRWRAIFDSHLNGSWEALGEYSEPPVMLAQKDTEAASGNHGRAFETLPFPTFLTAFFYREKDLGKPHCCLFIIFCGFNSRREKKVLNKSTWWICRRTCVTQDVDYLPFRPPCAGENMYFAFARLPNVTCACRGHPCPDSTNKRPPRRPQTGPLSSKPCCHDFTSTLLTNTREAGVSGAGEELRSARIAASFIVV